MIECSGCHRQLPDWAQTCQFCGKDVRSVARPVATKQKVSGTVPGAPKWVLPTYYAIAAYFAIGGLLTLVFYFLGERDTSSVFDIVRPVSGGVNLLLGLGLLFRIELIRGVVNFVCGLNIIFGLLGLVGILLGMVFSGFYGFLMMLYQVFNIALNALMIFLIGETETRAPNL